MRVEDFPIFRPTKSHHQAHRQAAQFRIDQRRNSAIQTGRSFLARWTGVLRVPKDGKYKFYLESDDGSRLFIDNSRSSTTTACTPWKRRTARAELKAGDHPDQDRLF